MGSEGSLNLSDLRKKESKLVKPPGKDQSNLGLGLATNTGPWTRHNAASPGFCSINIFFLEHQVCSRIIKSQSRWYPNRGISSHLRIKVGHFDLWNVLKKVWLDCAVRTSQVPQLPWMSKSKWVGEPDNTFCISLVRFPWPSRWIRPSSSLKSSHLSKAWKRSSSLLLWWNFNFLSTHFSSGIFLKPVRRRKSFWKSIGPNLSRSEKRNKTRPNWARKVLKLTMGDMFMSTMSIVHVHV